MPGHADELGTVVAEVGGPPVLRVGHELAEIALQCFVVQFFELFAIAERMAEGIGLSGVLV